ncbi:hypothetical protein KIN20_006224 [Parelaphostrongylus tenuis]|uniref:Uncharacterized protein n=1 Tax=Parelaphostrongylus tenuis TaxID=148309 RepID=A0AAD5MJV9_PARTN|nr:hypothetical protein KIN20_006224 [Parelaphostrongylus tenuis]
MDVFNFETTSPGSLELEFSEYCELFNYNANYCGAMAECSHVGHDVRGAELHPPLFYGSQQQRPIERHSKAVLQNARRLSHPVFCAVPQEDEKRIECWKYWDPNSEETL